MIMVFGFLAHSMKTNGRSLDRQAKSKAPGKDHGSIRHLVMQVIGLIASTESVDQIEKIVAHMFVVLSSEYVNDQLNDALNFLKESINTF